MKNEWGDVRLGIDAYDLTGKRALVSARARPPGARSRWRSARRAPTSPCRRSSTDGDEIMRVKRVQQELTKMGRKSTTVATDVTLGAGRAGDGAPGREGVRRHRHPGQRAGPLPRQGRRVHDRRRVEQGDAGEPRRHVPRLPRRRQGDAEAGVAAAASSTSPPCSASAPSRTPPRTARRRRAC